MPLAIVHAASCERATFTLVSVKLDDFWETFLLGIRQKCPAVSLIVHDQEDLCRVDENRP